MLRFIERAKFGHGEISSYPLIVHILTGCTNRITGNDVHASHGRNEFPAGQNSLGETFQSPEGSTCSKRIACGIADFGSGFAALRITRDSRAGCGRANFRTIPDLSGATAGLRRK